MSNGAVVGAPRSASSPAPSAVTVWGARYACCSEILTGSPLPSALRATTSQPPLASSEEWKTVRPSWLHTGSTSGPGER